MTYAMHHVKHVSAGSDNRSTSSVSKKQVKQLISTYQRTAANNLCVHI